MQKVVFKGPFLLDKTSDNFLYKEPQSNYRHGIYIMAWKYQGKYYPYYIGMTEKYFTNRIATHLRNYLSGSYYICSPNYLNKACESTHKGYHLREAEEKYLYGPLNENSFFSSFLPCFKDDNFIFELRSFIFNLEFFLAPLPEAEKDEILALEDYLSYLAYNSEAQYVIDSPKPKRESHEELGNIEVEFNSNITFIGLQVKK